MDEEDYNTSSSVEDYCKEDKLLLENARSLMRRKDVSSDEEVFRFGDSDSDEENWEEKKEEEQEDEEEDLDMGSDLEDEERLPDDRAWGKKKRNFYSTDFVDQDYEGIYQGKEAEIAELEEEEARNIQKRLAEQLNDADFSITETVDIAEVTEATMKQEVIISDLSKLTKRQKLDLVKKESPEFFVIVQDFKDKMHEVQKILPVINYFKKKVKQSFPALDFLEIKFALILKQLLEQLQDVDKKIIQPQVDEILDKIESGKEILINEDLLSREKKTLKILTKQKLRREKEATFEKEKQQEIEEKMEFEVDEVQKNQNNETVKLMDEKRPITYEMAKNKGLIPKRSKEQRNPRVKHRRKYEKAKIKRRGQVRTPRAEIPVYGGEPTGIKIALTKSIKLKN